jgi:hypothetical protein
MDATVNGIIGGVVAGVLLVGGGIVGFFNPTVNEAMKSPTTIFLWLILLSAIVGAQFVLSYIMVKALQEAPSQTITTTPK